MSMRESIRPQATYSRFSSREGRLTGPDGSSLEFRVIERRLEIQGASYNLAQGEYTPWIRLHFESNTGAVCGIVRLLLIRDTPDFALYATPVQIDPAKPSMPISHPPYYATYLARLLGMFATLEPAEDMSAMNDGVITGEAFLGQVELVQKEREAMFFSALERTRHGVLACVFDTPDRVQRMLFHERDVVERVYRDMDRVVGRTLDQAGPGTAVFVLSDHGFCAFRRGVNLNSWLLREGYLTLQTGLCESGDDFDGVDWTRTKAYAFGLAGVRLNLRGREPNGAVGPEEAVVLRKELSHKLRGLRDEVNGETAVQAVNEAPAVYSGRYPEAAPDLFIGYASGYSASWNAASGKATSAVFEANDRPWQGDHCSDPLLVPGVLFSNLRLNAADDPGIEDIAPTALRLFGVEPPEWMEGTSLIAAA
jgi:hypothetical protein